MAEPGDAGSGLDNKRVALGPVSSSDCVELHPTIADMDLQPIAIML
jgi:hypothetical protein